eukprot:CAMPEP_0119573358 /NCGR_PEP_ID=MMETSP1352-20130426/45080_1 /TAXON_ID=265584 /ORGANISM="Stauroneis constricta, Strain CCMP1120" /LENGTH=892 /DNA_ID=CAMNT_0007623045 /DNA_START=57 /DNA_END=2736 /DNA_ORIENTATION=+
MKSHSVYGAVASAALLFLSNRLVPSHAVELDVCDPAGGDVTLSAAEDGDGGFLRGRRKAFDLTPSQEECGITCPGATTMVCVPCIARMIYQAVDIAGLIEEQGPTSPVGGGVVDIIDEGTCDPCHPSVLTEQVISSACPSVVTDQPTTPVVTDQPTIPVVTDQPTTPDIVTDQPATTSTPAICTPIIMEGYGAISTPAICTPIIMEGYGTTSTPAICTPIIMEGYGTTSTPAICTPIIMEGYGTTSTPAICTPIIMEGYGAISAQPKSIEGPLQLTQGSSQTCGITCPSSELIEAESTMMCVACQTETLEQGNYAVSSIIGSEIAYESCEPCDESVLTEQVVSMLCPSVITDQPTTPVITDQPTTPVITDQPTTPVITDQPTTPVITDQPTTPVITDQPTTPVITDQPTTPVITDQPTTPVITDQPTTPVITDQPTTPVITDQPTTPVVTEESTTQAVVTDQPTTPVVTEASTTQAVVTDQPTTTSAPAICTPIIMEGYGAISAQPKSIEGPLQLTQGSSQTCGITCPSSELIEAESTMMCVACQTETLEQGNYAVSSIIGSEIAYESCEPCDESVLTEQVVSMLCPSVITDQPTTPVVTEESTTQVITDQPTTPVITDQPTTPVITDQPTTPVITDQPTTPVITDQPTTPVITDQPTTPVITDQPTTPVITDQPTTPVITDQPTTPVVTEESTTQAVVTDQPTTTITTTEAIVTEESTTQATATEETTTPVVVTEESTTQVTVTEGTTTAEVTSMEATTTTADPSVTLSVRFTSDRNSERDRNRFIVREQTAGQGRFRVVYRSGVLESRETKIWKEQVDATSCFKVILFDERGDRTNRVAVWYDGERIFAGRRNNVFGGKPKRVTKSEADVVAELIMCMDTIIILVGSVAE